MLQAQVDSDKVTVSALTKAVQEKDKLIEYLKKQEEEFSREMDKSTSVINNLKQALNESKKKFDSVITRLKEPGPIEHKIAPGSSSLIKTEIGLKGPPCFCLGFETVFC